MPLSRLRMAILAFLSAASACQCGSSVIEEPFIEVSPTALDFGPVPVGLSAGLSVEVKNLGKKALTLQPPTVEGNDFHSTTDTVTIAPGSRIFLESTFAPQNEGQSAGLIRIVSNAANSPELVVSVQGLGVPRLMGLPDGGAGGGGGDATGGGGGGGAATGGGGAMNWIQEAYLKASNTAPMVRFGDQLALSGDGTTLAVAASGDASAAVGINGDQLDMSAPNAGAVYVFVRSASGWSQQAYLKASNASAGDYFGGALAISRDGNTLAVAAFAEDSSARGLNGDEADNAAARAGAVYVFSRSGVTWSQQAYIKASNTGAGDTFGSAVALSGSGETLAVGAPAEDSNAAGIGGDQNSDSLPDSGAVYIWAQVNGAWAQQAYVKMEHPDSNDLFGYSLSLNENGDTMIVGAPAEDSDATGTNNNNLANSGAAFVFTRSAVTWSQQAFLKAAVAGAGDSFGRAVALSGDGNTALVAAPNEDSAALGVNGNASDDSANHSGAAYVFARTAAVWSQQAYLKASNAEAEDVFGSSVALSADGSTATVGAVAEDSTATGLNGAQGDNNTQESGAAYLFAKSAGQWASQTYVKSSNTGAGDYFGSSSGLSADATTLVVGAVNEGSNATGINGDQSDNSSLHAGAVYVFAR